MSARVDELAARLTRAERRWLADARRRLERARLVRAARDVHKES